MGSKPGQQSQGEALFPPVIPFKKEPVRRVQDEGPSRPGRPNHRQRAEFCALDSRGIFGKTDVSIGMGCPKTDDQFVQQWRG